MRRRGWRWLVPLLAAVAAASLLCLRAEAQLVAGVDGGAGITHEGFSSSSAVAGGDIGIALPAASHVISYWNALGAGFDRVQGRNGGSVGTSLSGWLTTARDAAHGRGLVLIGEAGLGRRWGVGLSGFTLLGAGAGWNFGGTVPYVEYRRQAGFHALSPIDDQVVVGVQWVLFG